MYAVSKKCTCLPNLRNLLRELPYLLLPRVGRDPRIHLVLPVLPPHPTNVPVPQRPQPLLDLLHPDALRRRLRQPARALHGTIPEYDGVRVGDHWHLSVLCGVQGDSVVLACHREEYLHVIDVN